MCIVVHVRVTGVCAIAHFARGRKRGKDGVIIFVKGLYFSSKAMMMTFPGRARIFSKLAFLFFFHSIFIYFLEKKQYKEIIYYAHKKKSRKRIEYGNCQLTKRRWINSARQSTSLFSRLAFESDALSARLEIINKHEKKKIIKNNCCFWLIFFFLKKKWKVYRWD